MGGGRLLEHDHAVFRCWLDGGHLSALLASRFLVARASILKTVVLATTINEHIASTMSGLVTQRIGAGETMVVFVSR